jgi:hypothetical protein
MSHGLNPDLDFNGLVLDHHEFFPKCADPALSRSFLKLPLGVGPLDLFLDGAQGMVPNDVVHEFWKQEPYNFP